MQADIQIGFLLEFHFSPLYDQLSHLVQMFPQTDMLCSVRFPVLQNRDGKIAFIEEEEAA